MAGLDILKQAGMSAVGMVEKAYIEIEDNRVAKIAVTQTGDDEFSASEIVKSNSGNNEGKHLGKFNGKEMSIIQQQYIEAARINGMTKTKRYKVRFNPSTLSISAYGGGRVAKTSFTGDGTKIEYAGMDTTILLNVQLIFDAESNEDCFMNEITDVKGNIKKGVNIVKNKRYSVQNQVEGFIAALRSPYTRRVRFVWGKNLSYKGVLTNLESEYTMFSIHGRPVRAVVNIGINCSDEDIVHDNMGQWKDSFDKAFSKNKTNLESAAQNVGNLINFNL